MEIKTSNSDRPGLGLGGLSGWIRLLFFFVFFGFSRRSRIRGMRGLLVGDLRFEQTLLKSAG